MRSRTSLDPDDLGGPPARRYRRQQRVHPHQVQPPPQVVGQTTQAEFGPHFLQAFHQKRVVAPVTKRPEDVFHDFLAPAHQLRMRQDVLNLGEPAR